jgi:hypothetical protein
MAGFFTTRVIEGSITALIINYVVVNKDRVNKGKLTWLHQQSVILRDVTRPSQDSKLHWRQVHGLFGHFHGLIDLTPTKLGG